MDFAVTTLKYQHAMILQTFLELKSSWMKVNQKECLENLDKLYALLVAHHEAETESLFSKLWDNPRLKEGGPLCTYYFDFFMLDRPFSATIKRINKIKEPEQRLTEIKIPTNEKKYFDANSMVCIPIEEHLSIQTFVNEIKLHLQYWPNRNSAWVSQSLDYVGDLIRKNIEKEENCFWSLAQQIPTSSVEAK